MSEVVSRAGRLPLVGGALALDFCNTTSGLGTAHCLEHLVEFEHLVAWSAHAGAIPAGAAGALTAAAARDPAAARAALDRALGLRRTLYALFHAVAHGEPVPEDALAALNAEIALAHAEQRLIQTASGFAWQFPAPHRAPAALAEPIVRSAAEVLLAGPLERIKQCPGHDCGWLFLDRSKNNIRVWCEMQVCGSRAKARARQARLKRG
jgi:predicted RNA-binding Zn ribbon-like protein